MGRQVVRLDFGLYKSSFIFIPFLCLKHCHQNAGLEIEQFGCNRRFYGYEFLVCFDQAWQLQLQHGDLPCFCPQTFSEGYRDSCRRMTQGARTVISLF
jgi:hypothetical protein